MSTWIFRLIACGRHDILMGILTHDGQGNAFETGEIVNIVAHESHFTEANTLIIGDVFEGSAFVLTVLDAANLQFMRPGRNDR
ncbi:MAG: hypothetical protein V2J65_23085, partial [Desulfobacteraceae bacterium]|nr:hypothetical protein [Desulfobacteraceae bacterium]